MEKEKLTSNLKFTVKYADGTRKEVQEGVLFEFKGNNIELHIGTARKEALFSIFEALSETITEFGLIEEFRKYIEPREMTSEEKYKLALFAIIRSNCIMPVGISMGKTKQEINKMTWRTMDEVLRGCDFERLKRSYEEGEDGND